jgi:hypothetical protein
MSPAAVLVTAGAEIPGTLGSWTLDGRGSDSPWLPASALPERAITTPAAIVVRFVGSAQIGAWLARAAPASDPEGGLGIGIGGRDEGAPPLNAVTLDPIRSGRWVVAVRLDRADGRGDATFYWLLSVL